MEDIPANAKLLDPILQKIMKSEITLHEHEVKVVNQYLKMVSNSGVDCFSSLFQYHIQY